MSKHNLLKQKIYKNYNFKNSDLNDVLLECYDENFKLKYLT